MAIKFSVDDGCASDIRFADLMMKYKRECVFYIPVEWHSLAYQKGYEPLSFYDAKIIADQFEIGSHTITHPHLTDLPYDEAKYEIQASKYMIMEMFGKMPVKFAPPRGYTNAELTEFTLAVYEEQRLTKGKGLVHIHPDSGANNNVHWLQAINDDTKELWGHSWELDKYGMWEEIEGFLRENTHR